MLFRSLFAGLDAGGHDAGGDDGSTSLAPGDATAENAWSDDTWSDDELVGGFDEDPGDGFGFGETFGDLPDDDATSPFRDDIAGEVDEPFPDEVDDGYGPGLAVDVPDDGTVEPGVPTGLSSDAAFDGEPVAGEPVAGEPGGLDDSGHPTATVPDAGHGSPATGTDRTPEDVRANLSALQRGRLLAAQQGEDDPRTGPDRA